MSLSTKGVKSVRLHHDTWSRLNKHLEEGESFDELVNEILNVYDEHKGKSTRQTRNIIKELDALQVDLADAVNGLRKTYDDEMAWNMDFGIKTFADALKFNWAKAQISHSRRLNSANPELAKLRLKWIEQILNVIWQIERLTKITEEHKTKQV
jgi:hypothetical protein